MGKTFRRERDDNKGKQKNVANKPKKDLRSYKGYSVNDINDDEFLEEE